MPGYIGLNRSMRSSGGGSLRDYTALTPANVDVVLTALGLTQAGTGTTWGETGQAATPLYAVAAAKVPLAVETIAGKKYFGPIVNPAGSNLALYSSDGTNAAWVKTNCTAALVLGGLADVPELVEELFNASLGKCVDTSFGSGTVTINANSITLIGNGASNRGAISRAINVIAGIRCYVWGSASNALRSGYGIGTAPINGAIVDSNFDIVAAATTQLPTKSFIPATTGVVYFNYWTFSDNLGDPVTINEFRVGPAHTLLTATTNNATCLQAITSSSGERVSRFWLARGGGSGTVSITQDNGSTWADVTLTSNPQPFDIAPATLANPTVGIRIATSGDSVRLYGVQHQVAARPLRPRIGPTAGSTVTTGARTMIETLAGSPTTVHLKLKLRTPTVSVSGQTVFSVDNNAATNLVDLKANGSGGFVLRKVIASSETAFSAFAVAVNTLIQIEVEISASVFRYRLDGGSWVTGTAGIPGSLSRFRIGHDNANTGQLGSPILALDEMSTAAMMTGDRGWNKAALA